MSEQLVYQLEKTNKINKSARFPWYIMEDNGQILKRGGDDTIYKTGLIGFLKTGESSKDAIPVHLPLNSNGLKRAPLKITNASKKMKTSDMKVDAVSNITMIGSADLVPKDYRDIKISNPVTLASTNNYKSVLQVNKTSQPSTTYKIVNVKQNLINTSVNLSSMSGGSIVSVKSDLANKPEQLPVLKLNKAHLVNPPDNVAAMKHLKNIKISLPIASNSGFVKDFKISPPDQAMFKNLLPKKQKMVEEKVIIKRSPKRMVKTFSCHQKSRQPKKEYFARSVLKPTNSAFVQTEQEVANAVLLAYEKSNLDKSNCNLDKSPSIDKSTSNIDKSIFPRRNLPEQQDYDGLESFVNFPRGKLLFVNEKLISINKTLSHEFVKLSRRYTQLENKYAKLEKDKLDEKIAGQQKITGLKKQICAMRRQLDQYKINVDMLSFRNCQNCYKDRSDEILQVNRHRLLLEEILSGSLSNDFEPIYEDSSSIDVIQQIESEIDVNDFEVKPLLVNSNDLIIAANNQDQELDSPQSPQLDNTVVEITNPLISSSKSDLSKSQSSKSGSLIASTDLPNNITTTPSSSEVFNNIATTPSSSEVFENIATVETSVGGKLSGGKKISNGGKLLVGDELPDISEGLESDFMKLIDSIDENASAVEEIFPSDAIDRYIPPARKFTDAELKAKELFLTAINGCLTPDEYGDMPIHTAVQLENHVEVKRQSVVLKIRANTVDILNSAKLTPLQVAVLLKPNIKVLQTLLEEKASISTIDEGGNNILHLAAINNRIEIIDMLLSEETDFLTAINEFNFDGLTPLMLCAMDDKHEIALKLLEAKAEPDIRDKKSGRTALFHAMENKAVNIVPHLLRFNANVKLRNFFGTNPFDAISEIETEASIKTLIMGHSADIAKIKAKKLKIM